MDIRLTSLQQKRVIWQRWAIVALGLCVQLGIITFLLIQIWQFTQYHPAVGNSAPGCLPPMGNRQPPPGGPGLPLPSQDEFANFIENCRRDAPLIEGNATTAILSGILALTFSLAGTAIFLRAQDRPTARIAYGLFYTVSLLCCLFPALGYPIPWLPPMFFTLISLINGFAATFVCLFPHPRHNHVQRKHTRWVPYIPLWLGCVLVLPSIAVFVLPRIFFPVVPLVTVGYNILCALIVVWMLVWGLRHLTKHEQHLATFVMMGVIILIISSSVAGFALLGVGQTTRAPFFKQSLFHLLPIPLIVLPIICDYALFRHELLGTTSLFSRKLMRALMWILLASLFIIPAIILLRTIDPTADSRPEWRDYVYGGLLALSLWLFPLIWGKLRDVGDSVFYHDFYQYNRELQQLSTALTELRGLDQISDFVLPQLASLLNTTEVALFIRATSQEQFIYDVERHASGTRSWHLYHHVVSSSTNEQTYVEQIHIDKLGVLADQALQQLTVGGQRSHEPLLLQHFLFLALYDQNQISGFLCLGSKKNQEPYSRRDKSFLATLAAQIAVLEVTNRYLEQARLDAHKLTALNHRVIAAQEEERRHLALDLHDDVLQEAMLLVRNLSDASTMGDVADTMPQARAVVTNLRRTCLALRPVLLEELGLAEALHWLARQTEQMAAGSLKVQVLPTSQCNSYTRTDSHSELAFYRVAQEALTNVIKHAEATTVIMRLRQAPNGTITLLIIDNGCGFQVGNPHLESLGLAGMHERMSAIGGSIHIRSKEGHGTIVRARQEGPFNE